MRQHLREASAEHAKPAEQVAASLGHYLYHYFLPNRPRWLDARWNYAPHCNLVCVKVIIFHNRFYPTHTSIYLHSLIQPRRVTGCPRRLNAPVKDHVDPIQKAIYHDPSTTTTTLPKGYTFNHSSTSYTIFAPQDYTINLGPTTTIFFAPQDNTSPVCFFPKEVTPPH